MGDDEHDGAPGRVLFASEPLRAVAEAGLCLAAGAVAPALPRGDGHPVLVLPGLMANDSSTWALRLVLRRLGYRVHGWGLGRNVGPTAACLDGMRDRVRALSDRHGRVSLVGWSLGGIYARELARDEPARVRQVITLASPFQLAHAGQTRAHGMFTRYSHLHARSVEFPLEHGAGPLPVPATSIYSRTDGIVAWQACLNPRGQRSENIAVIASHLGIGHHPAAIYAVADRLAQQEGEWAPFRPPVWLRPVFPHPDEIRPRAELSAVA